MTRSEKVFGFLLVALIGAWGCAKNPTEGSTGKNTQLESKVQRLEEDYRAAASARDQFRQKMNAAEERAAQLQSQLDQTRTERDGFKTDLQTRTTERDALSTQYEGFRNNIKNLLGKAESALAKPTLAAPPVALGNELPLPEGGSALRN